MVNNSGSKIKKLKEQGVLNRAQILSSPGEQVIATDNNG
jgi:hypothetical protein